MRSSARLSASPICMRGCSFLPGVFIFLRLFFLHLFLPLLFDLVENSFLLVLLNEQFHISDLFLNLAREGCRFPIETQIDSIVK